MEKNGIANVLRIIGIVIAICGGLIGFIMLGMNINLLVFGIALMISSFISGMMFVGFSEIIVLLQANVFKQEEIIKHLVDKETQESNPSKTVLQDIEDNLPVM